MQRADLDAVCVLHRDTERKYRKIFAHEDIIVPYRLRKDGVYEARVRRKDLHIEVSARDFAALKEKFIRALHKEEEPAPAAIKDPKTTNFGEFTLQWLEVKQALVKPSTFKEYDRLCRKNLITMFTNCAIHMSAAAKSVA